MPITPEISQIATLLAKAIADATRLKPHQIEAVTANSDFIEITYSGPEPGMGGGLGRTAIQTWDTKSGKLISDRLYDDPETLTRQRANVDARRASLYARGNS